MPSSGTNELADLLCSLFSKEELTRWVVGRIDTDILHEIPDNGAYADFVFNLTCALERRGILNVEFFERMSAIRPERIKEIEFVQKLFGSRRRSVTCKRTSLTALAGCVGVVSFGTFAFVLYEPKPQVEHIHITDIEFPDVESKTHSHILTLIPTEVNPKPRGGPITSALVGSGIKDGKYSRKTAKKSEKCRVALFQEVRTRKRVLGEWRDTVELIPVNRTTNETSADDCKATMARLCTELKCHSGYFDFMNTSERYDAIETKFSKSRPP